MHAFHQLELWPQFLQEKPFLETSATCVLVAFYCLSVTKRQNKLFMWSQAGPPHVGANEPATHGTML